MYIGWSARISRRKKGQAVTFPGGYDEVYLSDIGLFEMTEPFSVGAWIYTTEDDREKTQVIVGNAGEKNNFWRGWDFYLDTLNRVSTRLIHSLPHNYFHTRSQYAIPLNTWTHVAFTYDGSGKAATTFQLPVILRISSISLWAIDGTGLIPSTDS